MKQLALTLAPSPAPTLDNFFPGQNVELLALLGNLVADVALTLVDPRIDFAKLEAARG